MITRATFSIAAIAVSAVWGSADATATPRPKEILFESGHFRDAEMTGPIGHRTVYLTAWGDPSWGTATPSPCYLRAKENGATGWRLIPFEEETMGVSEEDIRDKHFSLKWLSPRRFIVETDFDICAVGLSFDGIYRRAKP